MNSIIRQLVAFAGVWLFELTILACLAIVGYQFLLCLAPSYNLLTSIK